VTGDPIESLSTDRYTPVARIGSGGQAEILLAIQRGSGAFEKLVVIKRLLPHLAGDERSRRRLAQEARLVARLHHPNVCQVLNLIENDSGPLLVLEYLEGVTVAQIAADLPAVRSADEIRLIAGVLQQASEGLHSAHTLRDRDGTPAGLVHRDVSSANLILTREGLVKVLDFGIAKAATGEESKVQSIRGTVPYMSPEQVRGEPLDARSDVFSLAVVAYEALTGLSLHLRADLNATWAAILTMEPPVIGDNQPFLPAALEEVLRKALEKEVDRRFSTAREFGSAVAEAVRELGGPMNFSEIAGVVEERYAEALSDRRRRFETMRAGARTPTVDQPASRWTQETFFSLPQVDLSVQSHSTLGLPPGTPLTSLSPVTVPERPRRGALSPAEPGAAGPVGAAQIAGGEADGEVGSIAFDPTVASGSVGGGVDQRTAPVSRRSPWLVLALAGLLAAAAVTIALLASDRQARSGEIAAGGGEGAGAEIAGGGEIAAGEPRPDPAAAPSPLAPPDAGPALAQAGAPPDAGPALDPGQPAPPDAGAPPPERAAPRRPDRDRPVRSAGARREAPARRGPGYFTVDSRPAAEISIDGVAMGQVPLYRVELAPGRHRVVATLEDGRTRSFTIVIRSGEDLRQRLRW